MINLLISTGICMPIGSSRTNRRLLQIHQLTLYYTKENLSTSTLKTVRQFLFATRWIIILLPWRKRHKNHHKRHLVIVDMPSRNNNFNINICIAWLSCRRRKIFEVHKNENWNYALLLEMKHTGNVPTSSVAHPLSYWIIAVVFSRG